MIEVKNLVKTFKDGPIETRVLKGINLSVANGEFIAIMGRSGAGKSTLLYQISLLDEPTSGEIRINSEETHQMSEREKMLFRLAEFGYVFQDYALLPELGEGDVVARVKRLRAAIPDPKPSVAESDPFRGPLRKQLFSVRGKAMERKLVRRRSAVEGKDDVRTIHRARYLRYGRG